MKKVHVLLFVMSFLLISFPVMAETTITVSDTQQTGPQTVVVKQVPVVVNNVSTGAFEGRITEVNYTQNLITIQDISGTERQVSMREDMINSYRVGDYVQVRPTTDVTVVTIEENPKDFEGEIIKVDISNNQILVLDINGRERRVDMKRGMINSYKVDDYVRIHLREDLKEAKTIETLKDVMRFEGNVVRVDSQGSRMVIRDTHGNEKIVLLRQGWITNYRVGNYVRVYHLTGREDVQLVRMLRVS